MVTLVAVFGLVEGLDTILTNYLGMKVLGRNVSLRMVFLNGYLNYCPIVAVYKAATSMWISGLSA